ncbi:MAG: ATP-binding protein [Clostridiaceae bacterium]
MGDSRIDYSKIPYILEGNGIIVEANEEFLNLTEYSKNQLVNLEISEVWKNLLRVNIKLNSIDSETEVIFFTKSLGVRFATISKFNENNKVIYTFLENKELRFENKFQFLNRLIDDNNTGVVVYSAQKLIVLKANDKFLSYVPVSNCNRESLYGRSIEEFRKYIRGTELEAQLLNVIETNKSYKTTEALGSIEGTTNRYWDSNIIPIAENGVVKFVVGILEDVTERVLSRSDIKSKKEQIEFLEKALITKDEFISLISHDFKTPLNVIYSAIQLIEHVYINQIPSSVRKLIVNIKQNTFRQLRLVNNLLDITRIKSGKFKLSVRNVDIVFFTQAITESVKIYANQKSIKLSFRSKVKTKIISIDDEKYERIILNLLSNAIKFTKDQGEISVILSEAKELNCIKIEVKDSGIGIPKDKQNLVFERFGQVDSNLSKQAEGTGIGLSLVKSLVDALGGSVELESKVNNGSKFTIFLPLNDLVQEEHHEARLDIDNRLVNSINVEFSDIYL